jgi:hypothetical protein
VPDDIANPMKFPDMFNREESKRRPDIWYYSKERRGEKSKLTPNSIEATINWCNAIINPRKFEKGDDKKYTLAPFKPEDITENTLTNS